MIFNMNGGGGGADVSLVNALAEDVLKDKVIVDSNGIPLTGTMPNNGSFDGAISTVAQSIVIPKGYHDGTGEVAISSAEQAKIIESNIADGITLLGKTGTYKGVTTFLTATTNVGVGYQEVHVTGLGFTPTKFLLVNNSTSAPTSDTLASFAYWYYDSTQSIDQRMARTENAYVSCDSSKFTIYTTTDGLSVIANMDNGGRVYGVFLFFALK